MAKRATALDVTAFEQNKDPSWKAALLVLVMTAFVIACMIMAVNLSNADAYDRGYNAATERANRQCLKWRWDEALQGARRGK